MLVKAMPKFLWWLLSSSYLRCEELVVLPNSVFADLFVDLFSFIDWS